MQRRLQYKQVPFAAVYSDFLAYSEYEGVNKDTIQRTTIIIHVSFFYSLSSS